MSDQSPDLRAIFGEALALSTDSELEEYLNKACQGDPSIRARVEALLKAHHAAGKFLGGLSPDGGLLPDSEQTADQLAKEQVGTRVGTYKLLQKLGEGGMGVVWVAEQQKPIKRRVALKIIKPGMDSQQVIARFEAERQALALMDHTNIAKVLDGGTTGHESGFAGRPFFVMELVKGVTITKYCDELNLSIRERLALFVPVCKAIQHAHQKGIIHRDLKPSNVLVAIQDGVPVPKVIDFGVAKALHQPLTERTMMTEFGAVVGTLEYMSPEQAELSALDIDTRADVYTLGVLLYELLTGSTPLDRKRLKTVALDEVLRMIREVEPPRPSTRLTTSENLSDLAARRRTEPLKLNAEVRGDLDWIVMKCLEKDRMRRYDTVNGLARDVERYLHDEPVEARPPSTAYRLQKLARKHRTACATVLSFAAVLLVSTVISTGQAIRATRAERVSERALVQVRLEKKTAEEVRQQAVVERMRAEELAEQRRWHNYIADMNHAMHLWETNNVEEMQMILNRYLPRAGEKDLRQFEWYHMWQLGWRFRHTPKRDLGDGGQDIALSPHGDTLAVALAFTRMVKLFDANTLQWKADIGSQEPGGYHETSFAEYSSDGRFLVHLGPQARSVAIHDFISGHDKHIELATDRIVGCAFRPNSHSLAIAHAGGIALVDLDTDPAVVVPFSALPAIGVTFSPDGKLLVAWSRELVSDIRSSDRTIRVWNVESGDAAPVHTFEQNVNVRQVAFSPKGTYLAWGNAEGLIQIVDTATWSAPRVPPFLEPVHRSPVSCLAFSPDESILATGSVGHTIRLWNSRDLTCIDVLKAHGVSVKGLVFSRDGNQLASVGLDRTVRLWDLGADFMSVRRTMRVRRLVSRERHLIALMPQGHSVLTCQSTGSGNYDNFARLQRSRFQSASMLSIPSLVELRNINPPSEAICVASSMSGLFAISIRNGSIEVYSGRDANLMCQLSMPSRDVAYSLAISPNGRFLCCGGLDGEVVMFRGPKFDEPQRLVRASASVTAIAFDPNNQYVAATGFFGKVVVWDLNTNRQPWTIEVGHGSGALNLAFAPARSPSSPPLLVVSSQFLGIQILELGPEVKRVFSASEPSVGIAFSRDGKTLFTGGYDGTLSIWDLSGPPIKRCVCSESMGSVSTLALSNDGRTLVGGLGWPGVISGSGACLRTWTTATEEDVQRDLADLAAQHKRESQSDR